MKQTRKAALFLYRQNFVRYVFVGGSTFLIDFLLLVFLHEYVNVALPIAASISYWVAIIYNFMLNRFWTFSAKDKANLSKHLTLYLALLGFNYLFTIVFIAIGTHYIHYAVAKIMAIGISVSWTYLIYKNVIFKRNSQNNGAIN